MRGVGQQLADLLVVGERLVQRRVQRVEAALRLVLEVLEPDGRVRGEGRPVALGEVELQLQLLALGLLARVAVGQAHHALQLFAVGLGAARREGRRRLERVRRADDLHHLAVAGVVVAEPALERLLQRLVELLALGLGHLPEHLAQLLGIVLVLGERLAHGLVVAVLRDLEQRVGLLLRDGGLLARLALRLELVAHRDQHVARLDAELATQRLERGAAARTRRQLRDLVQLAALVLGELHLRVREVPLLAHPPVDVLELTRRQLVLRRELFQLLQPVGLRQVGELVHRGRDVEILLALLRGLAERLRILTGHRGERVERGLLLVPRQLVDLGDLAHQRGPHRGALALALRAVQDGVGDRLRIGAGAASDLLQLVDLGDLLLERQAVDPRHPLREPFGRGRIGVLGGVEVRELVHHLAVGLLPGRLLELLHLVELLVDLRLAVEVAVDVLADQLGQLAAELLVELGELGGVQRLHQLVDLVAVGAEILHRGEAGLVLEVLGELRVGAVHLRGIGLVGAELGLVDAVRIEAVGRVAVDLLPGRDPERLRLVGGLADQLLLELRELASVVDQILAHQHPVGVLGREPVLLRRHLDAQARLVHAAEAQLVHELRGRHVHRLHLLGLLAPLDRRIGQHELLGVLEHRRHHHVAVEELREVGRLEALVDPALVRLLIELPGELVHLAKELRALGERHRGEQVLHLLLVRQVAALQHLLGELVAAVRVGALLGVDDRELLLHRRVRVELLGGLQQLEARRLRAELQRVLEHVLQAVGRVHALRLAVCDRVLPLLVEQRALGGAHLVQDREDRLVVLLAGELLLEAVRALAVLGIERVGEDARGLRRLDLLGRPLRLVLGGRELLLQRERVSVALEHALGCAREEVGVLLGRHALLPRALRQLLAALLADLLRDVLGERRAAHRLDEHLRLLRRHARLRADLLDAGLHRHRRQPAGVEILELAQHAAVDPVLELLDRARVERLELFAGLARLVGQPLDLLVALLLGEGADRVHLADRVLLDGHVVDQVDHLARRHPGVLLQAQHRRVLLGAGRQALDVVHLRLERGVVAGLPALGHVVDGIQHGLRIERVLVAELRELSHPLFAWQRLDPVQLLLHVSGGERLLGPDVLHRVDREAPRAAHRLAEQQVERLARRHAHRDRHRLDVRLRLGGIHSERRRGLLLELAALVDALGPLLLLVQRLLLVRVVLVERVVVVLRGLELLLRVAELLAAHAVGE